MSGGLYSTYRIDCHDIDWHDHELNELWRDLTSGKEFSVRGYDGLLQSLDFYECGDTERSDYMEAVQRFKRKWFHKTPRNRVEFYRGVIQRCADECKQELGLDGGHDEQD